jgi:hypothetical protein
MSIRYPSFFAKGRRCSVARVCLRATSVSLDPQRSKSGQGAEPYPLFDDLECVIEILLVVDQLTPFDCEIFDDNRLTENVAGHHDDPAVNLMLDADRGAAFGARALPRELRNEISNPPSWGWLRRFNCTDGSR